MKGSVGIPIVSGVAPGEATSVSITGVVGTSAVGSVTASNISSATVTLTGVAGTSAVGSVSFLSITVYTVTVLVALTRMDLVTSITLQDFREPVRP